MALHSNFSIKKHRLELWGCVHRAGLPECCFKKRYIVLNVWAVLEGMQSMMLHWFAHEGAQFRHPLTRITGHAALQPSCLNKKEEPSGFDLVNQFPLADTYIHSYIHTYIHAHIHSYTGGSLGLYECPSMICGTKNSETNCLVVVQVLIESQRHRLTYSGFQLVCCPYMLVQQLCKCSKINHWYYAKPTNYTSIGVIVGGGGAWSPIEWQPVTVSPSHPAKMEEPQTAASPWLGLISVVY